MTEEQLLSPPWASSAVLPAGEGRVHLGSPRKKGDVEEVGEQAQEEGAAQGASRQEAGLMLC